MIKVLDKFIADKIAAGEVIERPVSAVKELLENSIDAGAHSVIIEIRNGGKTYIRVTDDGSGIPADEAETAFLRHATSKISSIGDLDNIQSLGFRGEALASIAAVSKLTMVTKTSDRPAGLKLMLHGGKVISSETVGANTGTTIVVEDLFYNTPARRKFMGTDSREASAIIELVEHYAICYSSIKFMMVRNGETVFTTLGDGDPLAAVRSVYPDPEHSHLIEVDGNNVKGFISDPMTVKNNRRGQLFFVNGRLVSSPVIEKGIERGYSGRIFSGYPVVILFIDSAPSDIDVNIHPGKKEIKFLKSDEVIVDIAAAIDSALKMAAAVPSYQPSKSQEQLEPEVVTDREGVFRAYSYSPEPVIPTGEQSSIREYLANIARPTGKAPAEEVPEAETEPIQASGQNIQPQPERRETLHEENVSKLFDFDDLVYSGYVFNTYIIMQSSDTIYFFDQHAAHERINYEKFIAAYLNSEQFPQPVLTPVTINTSADVYYVAKDMLEPLRRLGYDISDFGRGTFLVRGVPSYVTLSEAESFVRSFLEETVNSINASYRRSGDDNVVDKLIMKSCKASVKGGENLSEKEVLELIDNLAKCRNPYACPHGRPTFIKFTKYEIEKSFKRR